MTADKRVVVVSDCPEAEYRASLSDDEFWAHVLLGEQPEGEPDYGDLDEVPTSNQNDPCPECGESGPCGYDMEGRPMVHITNEGDEE